MEDLINLLIEIANYLKYGKSKKSFKKELSQAKCLDSEKDVNYADIALKQYSNLFNKGSGIPTYAYFELRKNNWFKIYIINHEKKLCCRLKDTKLEYHNIPNKFYVKFHDANV